MIPFSVATTFDVQRCPLCRGGQRKYILLQRVFPLSQGTTDFVMM